MKVFINLVIRSLSLLIKFLFIIIAARILSPTELGMYGLIVALIGIFLYIIGFDYYTYSNRELVNLDLVSKCKNILNQFWLYILLYIFLFPVLYIVQSIVRIPVRYLLTIYCLVVFEHFTQECYRVFITIGLQTSANVSLFIKSSVWPLVVVIFFYCFSWKVNLDFIIYSWLLSSLCSVLYCLMILDKNKLISINLEHVSVSYIGKGLRIAFPFFCSTIAYKIIEYGNRFFINAYLSVAEVGAFSVYASIANILTVVVYTLVIMFYIPKLLNSVGSSDFYRNIKWFCFFTFTTSFVLLLCLLFGFRLFIGVFSNTYIRGNLTSFCWLLLSVFIYNMSLIPHYILYSQKKDLEILKSTILGAIVNLILSFILIERLHMTGIALAGLFGFLVIFIMKTIYCIKVAADESNKI